MKILNKKIIKNLWGFRNKKCAAKLELFFFSQVFKRGPFKPNMVTDY